MALTDNLSFYLAMDESSGNPADSTGARTFTNRNSTGYTTGKIGNAANLVRASGNYFDSPDHTTLRMNGAFSFQAWIYQPTSVTGQCVLFSKWNSGGPILHTPNGDGTEIRLFHTGSGSDYAQTSGLGMTADTWYHVVLVYDGSGGTDADKVKIYVNGTSQTLSFTGASFSSTMTDHTGNFYIGYWDTVAYYANMRMDEVAFWQRALTSGEVTSLYGGGSGLAYPLTVSSANAPRAMNHFRLRRAG